MRALLIVLSFEQEQTKERQTSQYWAQLSGCCLYHVQSGFGDERFLKGYELFIAKEMFKMSLYIVPKTYDLRH